MTIGASEMMARFGVRMRRAARERGLSAAALARAIGAERKMVNEWCRGHRLPQLWRLPALAAALGVSPSWLAFGEGEGPPE